MTKYERDIYESYIAGLEARGLVAEAQIIRSMMEIIDEFHKAGCTIQQIK